MYLLNFSASISCKFTVKFLIIFFIKWLLTCSETFPMIHMICLLSFRILIYQHLCWEIIMSIFIIRRVLMHRSFIISLVINDWSIFTMKYHSTRWVRRHLWRSIIIRILNPLLLWIWICNFILDTLSLLLYPFI